MDAEKVTMYPMVLPSVDESTILPEMLTSEELDELIEVMVMSNETIRAENDLLETYLANTDSQLIENMDSILDAATAAIHKAERTVQLGMMAAVTNVQDSSSTTPRSQSHGSGKIAAFTLSDKGPKIQPSQKMEIVQREMDCLKALFEDFKKQSDSKIFSLECRKDAAEIRLRELEASSNFLQDCITKNWPDHAMKIPGEKVIAYLEHRNRSDAALIKTLKTKRKNLKIKICAQNIKIKDLGEELKYVDFEKLIIEDKELHNNLERLSLNVAGLKKTNTVYLHEVGRIRDKISSQIHDAREIDKSIKKIEKKMKNISEQENKILSDIKMTQDKINLLTDLMKRFTAPGVLDYIRHKDELNYTRQALKVAGRKQELYEMMANNLRRKTIFQSQFGSENELKPTRYGLRSLLSKPSSPEP